MKLAAVISFVLVVAGALLPGPVSRSSLNAAQADCKSSFDQLVQDENWFDQLIDPVVTSEGQVFEKVRLYYEVHECLDGSSDSLPDELKIIHRLTEYFLIFAGGLDTSNASSSLYLISLETSSDPAVVQIRDEVGVDAPPGFVYVRTYSSREAMPALVRLVFENPDVQGVTILTRYIAVVTDSPVFDAQSLPKTVSHELVHAYFNSALGVDSLNRFPTWYDEGVAIYFSGSGNPSCARQYVDLNTYFNTCEVATEDYEQYDANFKYLESKWGRDRFLELVKLSFENSDPDLLYKDLGLSTYEKLAAEASEWKKGRDFLVTAGITGACALPLLLYLFFSFWQSAKDIEEVTGRARDSSSPEKGRSVDSNLKLIYNTPVNFSLEERARINQFWSDLSGNWHQLGSLYWVSYVLQKKRTMEQLGAQFEHQCVYCHRWTVVYLPKDVSREEYVRPQRSRRRLQSDGDADSEVLYPFAICLYCGNIYESDSRGESTSLRPLHRSGRFSGPDDVLD